VTSAVGVCRWDSRLIVNEYIGWPTIPRFSASPSRGRSRVSSSVWRSARLAVVNPDTTSEVIFEPVRTASFNVYAGWSARPTTTRRTTAVGMSVHVACVGCVKSGLASLGKSAYIGNLRSSEIKRRSISISDLKGYCLLRSISWRAFLCIIRTP
jgi:hypothetical protein